MKREEMRWGSILVLLCVTSFQRALPTRRLGSHEIIFYIASLCVRDHIFLCEYVGVILQGGGLGPSLFFFHRVLFLQGLIREHGGAIQQ